MPQTAMQELISAITQNGHIIINQTLIDTYLEKEKQQIIDANIAGMKFIPVEPDKYNSDAEQYYNEQYGG